MGFGGGTKVSKTLKEVAPIASKAVEKPGRMAQEAAAALRARRRTGARSLLSGAREDAQAGLATKLGGMG